MSNHPNFITIEGVDGAGKSTHVEKLVIQLRELGFDVIHTREPGGTPLGEKLRQEMLNAPMTPITETMMFFALRNEHLATVIRPALAAGKIVVCDRFSDSTYAYQCGSKGVSEDIFHQYETLVHGDLQPGLTLLFDLPVEESLRRLSLTGKTPDKFESATREIVEQRRASYLKRAEAPRFAIIDSNKTPELVGEQVDAVLAKHLTKIYNSKQTSKSKCTM